jgi:hypothetical protein
MGVCRLVLEFKGGSERKGVDRIGECEDHLNETEVI